MPADSSWLGYIIQESKIQMMIYECKPPVIITVLLTHKIPVAAHLTVVNTLGNGRCKGFVSGRHRDSPLAGANNSFGVVT